MSIAQLKKSEVKMKRNKKSTPYSTNIKVSQQLVGPGRPK
jgi:hypothetical protein